MMFIKKTVKTTVQKIIADGIVSHPQWADGRPIPSIIIHAADRPEIAEYIAAHEFQPPGDVKIHWGTLRFSNATVALCLTFYRPVETEFAIAFNTSERSALVDAVLHARGFYLQVGNPGDRVSSSFRAPKILIEVPDTGFMPKWNKILHDVLLQRFRKDGLQKKEAKLAVEEHVRSMREFWGIRRSPPSENTK